MTRLSAFALLIAASLLASTASASDLHLGIGVLGAAHEAPEAPLRGLDGLDLLLQARDLRGRTFDLDQALDEAPVLLVVWFSDCPTCPRALQRLVDWAQDQPVPPRVVGVNGDATQQRAWLRPFLRRSELELTVLADPEGELRRGLALGDSPAVVLLARDERGPTMVTHQISDRRVSMDGLARSWVAAVERDEVVVASR